MPTVLRAEGCRFVINTNDHRPAHAHVFVGGGLVIIKLNGRHEKPTPRDNYGVSTNDEVKAL
jgi:hypothetical protein